MNHIRKFESYSKKRKLDQVIKEAVQIVDDVYKVNVTADVPQSLLNAYIKKVKDNLDKNARQIFSDTQIAEEITKYVIQKGLNIDQLEPSILYGGAQAQSQGQTQVQAQGQIQTQTIPQDVPQGQPQAQAQAQAPVQVDTQSQSQAPQGQPQAQLDAQGQSIQGQPQAQSPQGQAQPQGQPQAQGQNFEEITDEEDEDEDEDELPL